MNGFRTSSFMTKPTKQKAASRKGIVVPVHYGRKQIQEAERIAANADKFGLGTSTYCRKLLRLGLALSEKDPGLLLTV
jgi:hypothetical protein